MQYSASSLGQFQGGESFLCGVVFSWVHVLAPNKSVRGRTQLGFLPNSLWFTVRSPPYSSSLHSTSLTGDTSSLKPEEQQEGDEVLEEEEDDDDDDFGEEREDVQDLEQERSVFIISYLVNSCGLSLQSAEIASGYLHSDNMDNAKAVIDLLKSYGVSNTNVSPIIERHPRLVLANPTATLMPKLEFLRSIGASNSDIDIILSKNSILLARSLKKHIIPFYNNLKSILGSDEKVVRTMKRISWIVEFLFSRHFEDNLSLLRKIGTSQSVLSFVVVNYPTIMGYRPDTFSQNVHEVLDLGFDPSKYAFVHALLVFSQMTRERREKKLLLYRRWHFSEKEILSAFKKNPLILKLSEKKINKTLDFLVHKMGYQPSVIASVPYVLSYSLEKRIIPRFSVVRALQLKGLIKGNVYLTTVLTLPEERFLDTFVFKYLDDASSLLSIFRGDMSIWELDCGLEETWRSKDL